MQNEKWWTPNTTIVAAMGMFMFLVMGISLFAPLGSRTGSDLIPAAVLEKMVEHEKRCQTIPDVTADPVVTPVPRSRC
jgi:hypothetical protein